MLVFPALFRILKRPGDLGSPTTREFMILLDRKVDNKLSPALVPGFVAVAWGVIATSAMVFFRYFPVEQSTEYCREKDYQGRDLYCYSNTSRFPLDCATQNRSVLYECYSFALPTGLGIAVAAALGIAKVLTVIVSIYVKVTGWFYKMTKEYSRKLDKCCRCCGRKRANEIYMFSNIAMIIMVLMTLAHVRFAMDLLSEVNYYNIMFTYMEYMFLTMVLSINISIIIRVLEKHCDQEEYFNIVAYQIPYNPRNWFIDEESGTGRPQNYGSATVEPALGENDIGYNVCPMEREEAQPLLTNNNRMSYGSVQA